VSPPEIEQKKTTALPGQPPVDATNGDGQVAAQGANKDKNGANGDGNGHSGDGQQIRSVPASFSPADHARARYAKDKQVMRTASSGLPPVEMQQDDKTLVYGKNGKIERVKDGDGSWVSNDGINFTQAGTDNKRTLSKDSAGHFIFVDHDLIVKEVQRIHQGLTELHQCLKGRDSEQCERDIRNALANKNPDEIKALETEYQSEFKQSLHDTLTKDTEISQPTQQAISVYWKGAAARSDADAMALADTALKHADINLFEEAMRDASPQARKDFLDKGGDQKIKDAFTTVYVNKRTGTRSVSETPDLARARDYSNDGKLSVATQVRDNKGNEQAIEAAIHNMTDADRRQYLIGQAIAGGATVDKSVSDQDKQTALKYYDQTHSAFEKAGNPTEKALWNALVSTPDNGTLAKIAGHRGWLYNDSTGSVAAEIEQINSGDLSILRDKSRGPQYRAQIENVLRSYLKDPDVKRVLDVVDEKAKAENVAQAQASGQRPVLDKMSDATHLFKSNDQGDMVKALIDMTPAEQAAYRTDANVRRNLDSIVRAHMSGDGQKAAHYILDRTLADKDGKITNADAREDLVVKLYERAMNNDSDNAVRDLQEQFKNHPELRDRINNPKTQEEKDFATNFNAAARDAVIYHALTPESTSTVAIRQKYGGAPPVSAINTGYDYYVKPLLDTGYLPVSHMVALSKNPEMPVDQKAVYKDLVYLSPDDRKKLLADPAYCSSTLQIPNSEDLKIAQSILKQGTIAPEDGIRMNIRDWGGGDEIMNTLQSTKLKDLPAVEKSYETKYGGSMEDHVERKLSGAQKQQAIRLFRQIHEGVPEQEIDSQVDASRARSGVGAQLSDALGHGTGAQLDDSVNQGERAKVVAAQKGKHLTDAELQNKTDANYTNLDNFIKDKQSVADTVTNIGTVAGAIGLTYVTGGAALPLLASGAAYGAAFRVASQKLVMGENYDATVKQLSKDITLGGIEGGVVGVTPELLMGSGAAAAKLASAEVLEGAAGQALSNEGREVLTTGLRKLVQDGLKKGATTIPDADIEALAVKAGNPDLAASIKSALPKAYKQEYEKEVGEGLAKVKREVVRNAKTGGVAGTIAGGANAAMNLDPKSTNPGRDIAMGAFTGGVQGYVAGGAMTGIMEGVKGVKGVKGAYRPKVAPEVMRPEIPAVVPAEVPPVIPREPAIPVPPEGALPEGSAGAAVHPDGQSEPNPGAKEAPKRSGPTGKGTNDDDGSEEERKRQIRTRSGDETPQPEGQAGHQAEHQAERGAVTTGKGGESVKTNPDGSEVRYQGTAGDAHNPLRVTQTTDALGGTVKYEYQPGTNTLKRVTYDSGVQFEVLNSHSVRITGPKYPEGGVVEPIKLRVDNDGTRYMRWQSDPETSVKLDRSTAGVDAGGHPISSPPPKLVTHTTDGKVEIKYDASQGVKEARIDDMQYTTKDGGKSWQATNLKDGTTNTVEGTMSVEKNGSLSWREADQISTYNQDGSRIVTRKTAEYKTGPGGNLTTAHIEGVGTYEQVSPTEVKVTPEGTTKPYSLNGKMEATGNSLKIRQTDGFVEINDRVDNPSGAISKTVLGDVKSKFYLDSKGNLTKADYGFNGLYEAKDGQIIYTSGHAGTQPEVLGTGPLTRTKDGIEFRDSTGRELSVSDKSGTAQFSRITRDGAGNITELQHTQETLEYAYDNENKLTKVTVHKDAGDTTYEQIGENKWKYTDDNNPDGIELNRKMTVSPTDGAFQQEVIYDKSIDQRTATYDQDGTLTRIKQNAQNGPITYEKSEAGHWKVFDKDHPQGQSVDGVMALSPEDGAIWKIGPTGERQAILADGSTATHGAVTGNKVVDELRNGELTFQKKASDTTAEDDSTSFGKSKSEIYFADMKTADGTREVVVRTLKAGDSREMGKIRQAQIEDNVNRTVSEHTGLEEASAPMAIRSVTLPDGTESLATVQFKEGIDVGAWLKQRAAEVNHLDLAKINEWPPDTLKNLIDTDPMAKKIVGDAALEMFYKGNDDTVEYSQQTIRETAGGRTLKPGDPAHVVTVDMKNDFTLAKGWRPGSTEAAAAPAAPAETTADPANYEAGWGFGSQFGSTAEIARSLGGKRLYQLQPDEVGQALQAKAEKLLGFYKSAEGQSSLLKNGLSQAQIDAARDRLQSLVDYGYPPFKGQDTKGSFWPSEEYQNTQNARQNEVNARASHVTTSDVLGHNDGPTPSSGSGGQPARNASGSPGQLARPAGSGNGVPLEPIEPDEEIPKQAARPATVPHSAGPSTVNRAVNDVDGSGAAGGSPDLNKSGGVDNNGGDRTGDRQSLPKNERPDGNRTVIELNAKPIGVVDAQGRITEISDYGKTHKFAYDAQGNVKSFTRTDGTELHSNNGTQWYKTVVSASGQPEEQLVLGKDYPVRVKATATGDIEYRYGNGDKDPVDIAHLDGSVERMRAGGRSDYRIADYGFEKQVLAQSIEKGFPDAARASRFRDLVAKFDESASARGLDQNEKALFYKQISRLLSDRPESAVAVPLSARADLAEQVLNHSNDVSTVDQGCNGTCTVNSLEHRDYSRHPDQMAKLVADAALTGQYVTADGQVIQLSTLRQAIKPDNEAKHGMSQQAKVDGGVVHVDGYRDYASQIVQNTMANIKAQTESYFLVGNTVLSSKSIAYEKGGNLVGYVERPGDIRGIYDRDHKLLSDWKPGDPAYTYGGKPWNQDGRFDPLSLKNVVYGEDGKLLGYLPHNDATRLFDAEGHRLTKIAPGQSAYDEPVGKANRHLVVTRTKPGQVVFDRPVPKGPTSNAARLMYNDGQKVVELRNQKGDLLDSPHFISSSDYNDTNAQILGHREEPFVIRLGDNYRVENDTIFVHTKEDLSKAIVQLQKDNNLPAAIVVHTSHAPFSTGGFPDASGITGASHVVNIDGFDPEKGMVLVGNSWGTKNQYLDEGLPLQDLFDSLPVPQPVKPPETSTKPK
jgi:YD repeat-containing protein